MRAIFLELAAQHQVSSGDPSEQEVGFSGMAYYHPDQCGDIDICL